MKPPQILMNQAKPPMMNRGYKVWPQQPPMDPNMKFQNPMNQIIRTPSWDVAIGRGRRVTDKRKDPRRMDKSNPSGSLSVQTNDVGEVLGDMAKEEWGVDGYGSMKGLIRLRSPGHEAEVHEDEEDEEGGAGSSDSDVEEHVEVERRLDHDLSRTIGGGELTMKERLFLMERELGDLRRRLQFLERQNQIVEDVNEEVVENGSDNESEGGSDAPVVGTEKNAEMVDYVPHGRNEDGDANGAVITGEGGGRYPEKSLGNGKEIYSIKLPGNPKLGEGKPENQNHAIIFTRGNAVQTIDMNQEALKMRNLLEEFHCDHGLRRATILGVREHVFTGRVRMHYGHPDVFDRVFHITRGGISKASRVINISEDIYSGKVAGGNGEQVLSRDVYRLGQLFDFFRMLSFYYTTVGYYFCTW
ncbi:Callose synthase 10 [Senna tora]|uniref:Callose synthase 10 n=1 Tax=Senna tora TaxID=362788 RepID=A0A835CBD6_9FABA|nr:Callose synthase 10 [Senna tora]